MDITMAISSLMPEKQAGKTVHIFGLKCHCRVNIAIHCNGNPGMSQNFAQAFDIEAQLYASCGKSMPGRMKIGILNSAVTENPFKMVLYGPRLHKALAFSCQKKRSRSCIFALTPAAAVVMNSAILP